MKLKNILIVVRDLEKSKQFYHDLFGLQKIFDSDGKVILTEGLVLQEATIWRNCLENEIVSKIIRFYDPDGNLIEVGTPVSHNA